MRLKGPAAKLLNNMSRNRAIPVLEIKNMRKQLEYGLMGRMDEETVMTYAKLIDSTYQYKLFLDKYNIGRDKDTSEMVEKTAKRVGLSLTQDEHTVLN